MYSRGDVTFVKSNYYVMKVTYIIKNGDLRLEYFINESFHPSKRKKVKMISCLLKCNFTPTTLQCGPILIYLSRLLKIQFW